MKNKRLLIGAFIASVALFTSCKKPINKEKLNPQNPQVPIVNPEQILENVEIKLSEDLIIKEAPQGMTASVKILEASAITGGTESLSEIKEITLIGSKVDTEIEVSLRLKEDNSKSLIQKSEIGTVKTYTISEFRDGKWIEIGNLYPSTERELKARVKINKATEQKIILAIREKTDLITITNKDRFSSYSSAGVFISEALRSELALDIMLYPSNNLAASESSKTFNWNSTEDFSSLYQYLANKVILGTIKGKGLKEFLAERSNLQANLDIQAGLLEYDIKLDKRGKLINSESTFLLNGKKIIDEKEYKIGIDSFYESRYGLSNFGFIKTGDSSTDQKTILTNFVKNTKQLPNLEKYKGKVTKAPGAIVENVKIYEIQGRGFKSLYEADTVKGVEGIITAIDVNGSNGANGINGFYMQDYVGDGDSRTSDGIYVFMKQTATQWNKDEIRVGNKISLDAVVEERKSEESGISQTQLKDVKNIVVIQKDHPLPAPVVLGEDRKIPQKHLSTFVGDITTKTILQIETDGIDFWESIEGMRVAVKNPKVTDVYGSNSIYVVAPDNYDKHLFTHMGGLVIEKGDMNPEIIHINNQTIIGSTEVRTFGHPNNITKGGNFNGVIEGVIQYNVGSNGGYFFVNTTELQKLSYTPSSNQKEITNLVGDKDHLTIGSYNVENLNEDSKHMSAIAESIIKNLKSPDIVGLIEIQDNDGEKDSGNTSAAGTLDKLVASIKAQGGPDYRWVNIDPENNQDGGAPGSNIRVAYIYNPVRVQFDPVGTPTYKDDYNKSKSGVISADGKLMINPIRINSTDSEVFKSSRKPLAAQFIFNGERITVIANHLNSKRGDTSAWGAVQPVVPHSEVQRRKMIDEINSFAEKLEDAGNKVVLLGDFNEFYFGEPMQGFNQNKFTNLLEAKLKVNERFTYTFKGNAQTLDHILVSRNLVTTADVDVVHINAGFPKSSGALNPAIHQISDHDPIVARLKINNPGDWKPAAPIEPAGFRVSAISGQTTENGGKATFTVRLTREPKANVIINLSSSNEAEGIVNPGHLTFTPFNRDKDQIVTVTGVEDDKNDGDQAYKIILSKAISTDTAYKDLKPSDVDVINKDIPKVIPPADGVYLETFENMVVGTSSYVDGNFLGQYGIIWTYIKGRTNDTIDGKAIMLGRNQSPQSELFTSSISGGIKKISFDYKQAFATAVDLDVIINDVVVGNVKTDNELGVKKSAEFIINNVNGDFVIKFKSKSNGAGQVTIDNISWTNK